MTFTSPQRALPRAEGASDAAARDSFCHPPYLTRILDPPLQSLLLHLLSSLNLIYYV
ncbi:hypothetical protein STEG23_016185, partial [Scotinomys teguina]